VWQPVAHSSISTHVPVVPWPEYPAAHSHVNDAPFRRQIALLPSQLLERQGSALLHPLEDSADASAVSSHFERMPTLKTTSVCLKADELHE